MNPCGCKTTGIFSFYTIFYIDGFALNDNFSLTR